MASCMASLKLALLRVPERSFPGLGKQRVLHGSLGGQGGGQ